MNTHPALSTGAAVAFLAAGFYFTLGSGIPDPQEPPVAGTKPPSTQSSVDVQPETASEWADAGRDPSFVRSDRSEIQEVNAKTDRLNGELKRLRRELAFLRERLEALSAENRSGDDSVESAGPSAPDQSPADPLQLDPEKLASQELERMTTMDRFFQEEATDEQWSRDVTRMVTEVFQDMDASHTALSRVQCRSTLCLVEVEHSDAEAAEEFALYFPIDVGEALPQASYYTENFDDGSSRVTMYFARDGYEIPQLEP